MRAKFGIILSVFLLAAVCELSASTTQPIAKVESNGTGIAARKPNQPELQLRLRKLDCSHLVHALYESLGLKYQYATSRTLYQGIREFDRVTQPEFGDLVVWRGHVGIVIDPSQHKFVSALRSGVKAASYLSKYWQRLGRPHFFRYALSDKLYQSREDLSAAIMNAVPQSPTDSSD